MAFPSRDIYILRELAREVAEAAARPCEAAKASMWTRFNDLNPSRPMVLVFPEGSWRELLPGEQMECTDALCRRWEYGLRQRLYYRDFLQDDNVISDVFGVPIVIRNTGWGIQEHQSRPDLAVGAAHFEPVIVEEADIGNLRTPEVSVDWDETERGFQRAAAVFGDILSVEKRGVTHPGFAIIDLFAKWRGLDQLFWDMVDRPQWLHGVLQFMTDGMVSMQHELERLGALSLNNGAHYCGSGGTGFTRELPQADYDGEHVRSRDQWGFATTQIFSEVSPAMHAEFALHYEIQWLKQFGLNAYGCCEPLHLKMDDVEKIPHLRRISMSPWVDMDVAAERLGNRYVFSRKPNPAVLAAPHWDPESVRKSLRDDLHKTRGCVVELVMKDTHTCLGRPHRMREWVQIAKEEVDRFAT